jgi:hypothetical protein
LKIDVPTLIYNGASSIATKRYGIAFGKLMYSSFVKDSGATYKEFSNSG